MLYEVRTYHINPGRMPDIAARFRDHTLSIFPRHGIKVTDFFEDGDRLLYICEFSDMDAREAAWASFRRDPEWVSVKAQTEANGPLVGKIDVFYMNRAPYFQAE